MKPITDDQKFRIGGRRIVALGLLMVSASAFGVDGVVEINQAKILASGGFPYTISTPGSYRLTGNIDISAQSNPKDLTAIAISASNVTLDLNGFAILGPNSCSGTAGGVSCTLLGLGAGVNVTGSAFHNTVVKNGIVKGMGGNGVYLYNGYSHSVDRVQATENGSIGIYIDAGSVTNSQAIWNGADGISIGVTVVSGNTVRDNKLIGIHGNDLTTLVTGNMVYSNGGYGLSLGNKSAYSNNVIINNNGGAANAQVFGGVSAGLNVCDHSGGASTVCP